MPWAPLGTSLWALRVKCTRQRCQAAPRSVASMAGDESRMGVADDQADAGEAAGGQRAQEPQPVGTLVTTGGGHRRRPDAAHARRC